MQRRMPLMLLVVVLALGAALVACGDVEPAPSGAAPEAPDPDAGFDADRSLAQAEAYLGVAEADVEETVMVRILRRGDEQLAGTMDLRPGRLNLELDEDSEGTYRVTRVVVETDDGSVVVE